mmetsp:Transcript_17798/g.36482  ORF Transcript_17798/g.36482 Transcript_17798/m.36482 type:complete len:447 (+) Transcript_17798:65-1405(+)
MNNKSTSKTKLEPPKGSGGGDRYVYRDWSNATPCQTDLDAIEREKDLHPDARKLPVKLNAILNNREFSSIIVWLPHGRSWRILDRDRLTKEVLPLFFQNANFNSFVRLVNAWGFRRIKSGVDGDSYYHEMFLRGMPHLHIRTKRLLSHEKKAPVGSIDESPNFHAMPKLPEIESVSVSSSLCSISIESDPIAEQKRNQAQKNSTYISNAGSCLFPSANAAKAGVGSRIYSTSILERHVQEPNATCNNSISKLSFEPASVAVKDPSVFSRQSIALASEILCLDRLARLQSAVGHNERMQIMERQYRNESSLIPPNFSSTHLAHSFSPSRLGYSASLLYGTPSCAQAQARVWSLNLNTPVLPSPQSSLSQPQKNMTRWDVDGQPSSTESQYFSRIPSSNAGYSCIAGGRGSLVGNLQQNYLQNERKNLSNTDTPLILPLEAKKEQRNK